MRLQLIKTSSILLFLGLLASAQHGMAQSRPWAVEANLLWPFIPEVEIYSVKAVRQLGERNYVIVGALVRPGTKRDDEGDFSEYGVQLGYRHDLWRGLHVEAALIPSFAALDNNVVDGRDYDAFVVTGELYLGYRFDLGKEKRWYLAPQAGLGLQMYQSEEWPVRGDDSDVYPVVSLQAGIRF